MELVVYGSMLDHMGIRALTLCKSGQDLTLSAGCQVILLVLTISL